jgi:hypothetical protein
MRWRLAIAATALLIVLSGASLIAQGKGRGGAQAPKAQAPAAKPTQGGPKAPTGVKPAANKSGATKTKVNAAAATPKGKSVASTAKTTTSPKTSTTTAKNTKSTKGAAAKDTTSTPSTATTTAATTTSTSTSSGTTTTTTTLSTAQQKLQKNTNLANKLGSRLPAGTDLIQAAAGFRNLGQFVAAVNVSNNLGIPFADLKVKMVDEHLSLGQSIQALKPTASGTIEARRAEYDAQGMIYQSEQEAQASATTTSKKKTKPRGSGGGDV